MAKIYSSAEELVGNTPLLELKAIAKAIGTDCRILAKLEGFNPAGSAKDRVASAMVERAEKLGLLKPGGVIIEPTSGNTGIGIARVAAIKGYKAIIVMPDTMSAERRALVTAYGGEVALSSGDLGMNGAIELAKKLSSEIPNSYIPDQFNNPANPEIHYKTTAPEIWEATEGKLDIFVAGVGSGGTLGGISKYMKEKNSSIQIVAAEPAGSPLLSGGKAGKHGLQGIGANFIPAAVANRPFDRVVTVTDDDAFEYTRKLAQLEGILCGISSGAALWAACKLALEHENKGKTIVTVLPDTGERYLSTGIF